MDKEVEIRVPNDNPLHEESTPVEKILNSEEKNSRPSCEKSLNTLLDLTEEVNASLRLFRRRISLNAYQGHNYHLMRALDYDLAEMCENLNKFERIIRRAKKTINHYYG